MLIAPSTQSAIRSIVAAASSLEERLSSDFLPEQSEDDPETVNARLDTWCRVIARGNRELFQQRLAWDGLELEKLRRVLGKVHLRESASLPAWSNTLSAMLHLAPSLSSPTDCPPQESLSQLPCIKPDDPLPFEELLVPFILVARQRLAEQRAGAHLLSAEAHNALERDLLEQLTTSAAYAFHKEFSIKLFQARSPLTRLLSEIQNSTERVLYQGFVREMLQGELVAFFQRYPVLGRLLACMTDLWVEAAAEFLQRLADDWGMIEQMFGDHHLLQQVVAIQARLSDPHRGRRGVLGLTFASGHKLVYKPKNLGIEIAYNKLLAWCNDQGLSLPFKVLTVINRGEYGWVEFVERQRCQDVEATQRYYRRAGMLLCLMYALVGTDCHHENLIPHGEYPVLVDMEALMQHRPRLESLDDGAQAQLLAQEVMADSVLHTGLLPSWRLDRLGQGAYDISGLRGPDELVFETEGRRWEHINSDRMVLKVKPIKIEPPSDYASQSGVPLRLENHREDVLHGFEQFYQFLLAHRNTLQAADSPLIELRPQQIRFLFRNTEVYGSLLRQLLDPRHLGDGVDRSIQLEALGVAQMPPPEFSWEGHGRSRWWPVFAEERQAMQRMDIPFFSSYANNDGLPLASGAWIETCFREPSFDLVITRLQALGAEDLERQLGFISGALYAYVARDPAPSSSVSLVHLDGTAGTSGQAQQERLVAHALRIAEEIDLHAIRAADGSASWIVPQYLFWAERYQLQPVGADLYTGACGMALFLAAREHVTGGAEYRELALGALAPLRKTLHLYGPQLAKELGIGAASGLASVIYAMIRISQWLEEPELLKDAQIAAQLLTFESIAADTVFDIFAGSAGTILGLLALYEALPDQSLLARAVACGQHLLEARVVSPLGYRTWPGFNGKLLTGFSHGAAGIAYALLRLYAITHNAEYRAAAQEGIAYEDSVFLPEINNWPDLRSGEPLDFRVAWCHGAPGIGLARLSGLAWLDTEQVRQDIEIALQRTLQEGVQALDHLCCGNMGRVDILLTAARQLSDSRAAKAVEQFVGQILARVEQTGTFALDPLLPRQVHHLGFFQGTSGLGYSLLRLAYPEQLPSVLFWQ